MKQRKPGDYVVNAELTDEQRERFVKDCLAAGANERVDKYPVTYTGWHCVSEKVVGADIRPLNERNCTHEYKENPMTQPQIMRQIADAMERNPDGWWREFERQVYIGYRQQRWIQCCSPVILLDELKSDNIRPKPRTYTLHIENMPEPEYCEIEKEGQAVTINFDFGAHESAQQAMDKLKEAMGVRDES